MTFVLSRCDLLSRKTNFCTNINVSWESDNKKRKSKISKVNFSDLSWQASELASILKPYWQIVIILKQCLSKHKKTFHSHRSLEITCISCVSVFFIYLTVTLLWALPRPALTSLCHLNLTYHNCLCCLTSSFSMRFSHFKKISTDKKHKKTES